MVNQATIQLFPSIDIPGTLIGYQLLIRMNNIENKIAFSIYCFIFVEL